MTKEVPHWDSFNQVYLYDYFNGYGEWRMCQSNPFPFVQRWRVINPLNKYVATFKYQKDAEEYIYFKLGHLVPIKERT